MYNAVQGTTCKICNAILPEGYDIARHIGVRHNYLLYVYEGRMSGQYNIPIQLYPSKCVKQDSITFQGDPSSIPVTFDLNTKENFVTVEFETKLSLKSFKSDKKFDNTNPSCDLCSLFRGYHWEPPQGDTTKVNDAFLIHLANTHFKKELERMFVGSNGNTYSCCDDNFNFQTLIEHLKEEHTLLQETHFLYLVDRAFLNSVA